MSQGLSSVRSRYLRMVTQVSQRITPGFGPRSKMNMYVMFSVKITKRMNSSSDMRANYGQMR